MGFAADDAGRISRLAFAQSERPELRIYHRHVNRGLSEAVQRNPSSDGADEMIAAGTDSSNEMRLLYANTLISAGFVILRIDLERSTDASICRWSEWSDR
jgi:hypothetical protein